jgi:16S rRNA processing protein RimM
VETIRIGQVLGAFGVQGAVKVLSLTDFPDRYAPGAELMLDGSARRVEWSRQQPAALIVKLSGLDDRTEAGRWRGCWLEVPEAELRPLPAGRWYHHQLVGLAVRSRSGVDLGVLTEVVNGPAHDVWVARKGAAEHLVPVAGDAVLNVDLAAGHVIVADWLLDVEEA